MTKELQLPGKAQAGKHRQTILIAGIVILGVLAAIIVPTTLHFVTEARQEAAADTCDGILRALETNLLYRAGSGAAIDYDLVLEKTEVSVLGALGKAQVRLTDALGRSGEYERGKGRLPLHQRSSRANSTKRAQSSGNSMPP